MISHVQPPAGRASVQVYQLKVVLVGTEPPIWRRLRVPGNANLGWLHAVLQVAVGWTNSHLHHFLTREARYCNPRDSDDPGFGKIRDFDEAKAMLAQVLPKVGAHFMYEYDFGDSWHHEIKVEKILSPDAAAATRAVCVDGARACPPEDCGGIWGYQNLLEILKNRKHPEHKSMKEWLGHPIDAEAFDAEQANAWLGRLKWPRVTETQLRKVLMGRDGYQE
jgi:hypothetical protein